MKIRVTTSEEVFRQHGSFFRNAGFSVIDWQVSRYRKNTSELLWKLDMQPCISELRRYAPSQSQPAADRLAEACIWERANTFSNLCLFNSIVVVQGGIEAVAAPSLVWENDLQKYDRYLQNGSIHTRKKV